MSLSGFFLLVLLQDILIRFFQKGPKNIGMLSLLFLALTNMKQSIINKEKELFRFILSFIVLLFLVFSSTLLKKAPERIYLYMMVIPLLVMPFYHLTYTLVRVTPLSSYKVLQIFELRLLNSLVFGVNLLFIASSADDFTMAHLAYGLLAFFCLLIFFHIYTEESIVDSSHSFIQTDHYSCIQNNLLNRVTSLAELVCYIYFFVWVLKIKKIFFWDLEIIIAATMLLLCVISSVKRAYPIQYLTISKALFLTFSIRLLFVVLF